jgi:hypothetical protein
MSEKSLRILVVAFGLLFCYTGIMWNKSDNKLKKNQIEFVRLENEVDSLRIAYDSLHSENFSCQIELGRHQVAFEIFMERNPKAAEQYGTIISDETE